MRVTLKLIEQATVLAGAGNFAKAAEQLGISQPTLSRNIAALESEIGLQLFDRGRNGASPTVFGRVLVERGARVMREAEALHDELRAVAGMDSGQLTIVAGPYALEDPVAQAVAQLINERPGLHVRISQVSPDEIAGALLSRCHELGFGGWESQFPHELLTREPLKPRRLFLACRPGHPLLGQPPTLDQVLAFPMITVLLQGQTGTLAATGKRAGAWDTRRRGFTPAVEVNSFDAARRITRSTDALLPATATMLAADISAGHVKTLDFDIPALRSRPTIVRLADRTLSPAAQRLLDVVRAIDAGLPGVTAT